MNKDPQRITLETYKRITEDDNILHGVRRQMLLNDVIESYPVLFAGLEHIIKQKYDSVRYRYFPYILSVITNREKWSADAFYVGVKDQYEVEFDLWQKDFKDYIIDNEHLHEFWIL